MDKEVLKLALEALEIAELAFGHPKRVELMRKAITAIKEALAQSEQEPVAYPEGDVVGPCICGSWPGGKCLKCPRITTPPQRTWVGLTDEEVDECYYWKDRLWTTDELVRHVEAKLKEKNT